MYLCSLTISQALLKSSSGFFFYFFKFRTKLFRLEFKNWYFGRQFKTVFFFYFRPMVALDHSISDPSFTEKFLKRSFSREGYNTNGSGNTLCA